MIELFSAEGRSATPAIDFPPWPDGPFTPAFYVGGSGGSPFADAGGTDGRMVATLGVWKTSSCLQGIQLTYTDGNKTQVYGAMKGDYAQLSLAPGEKITELTLWGNGKGTRTGRIKLTTDKGQSLDHGKDTNGQTAYSAPIGSGLLVGVAGRCAAEIDMLGLVFLTDVKSVTMTNVVYHNSPVGTSQGISPVLLDQAHIVNPDDKPFEWDFKNTVTRVNSNTWSQSSTTEYGVSVSVSASFFDIVKVSTGFNWSQTEEHTSESSTSTEISLSWGMKGELDPGESIMATASCQLGNVDVDYTALVTVVLKSGLSFSYQATGVFSNVLYAAVTATAEPEATG